MSFRFCERGPGRRDRRHRPALTACVGSGGYADARDRCVSIVKHWEFAAVCRGARSRGWRWCGGHGCQQQATPPHDNIRYIRTSHVPSEPRLERLELMPGNSVPSAYYTIQCAITVPQSANTERRSFASRPCPARPRRLTARGITPGCYCTSPRSQYFQRGINPVGQPTF